MSFTTKKYIIYLIVIIAIFPVMFLRDFTPDNELRYISIANEAMENNSFFAFTNHGEPYADKPPLYFWGIMGLKALTGTHSIWLISLLAFIPAIAIVEILDRLISRESTESVRLLSIIILLSSALFIGASVTLRMDMLMSLFILLSLKSFWIIYNESNNHRIHQWLFPLFIFLAVFSKGPLGFLIPLLCTIAFLIYERKLSWIGKFWGWRTWIVLIPLCALWFFSVYLDGGKEYLDNLLFHQTVDRAVNAFHHKRPFYYYLIHIWYCIAPWTFLILGCAVMAIVSRKKLSPLHVFILLSTIVTIVLLSLISAKLQIYILPVLPLLIYGGVMFLPHLKSDIFLRLVLLIPAAVFLLAYPAYSLIINEYDFAIIENEYIKWTALLLTLTGVATICMLLKPKPLRRILPISLTLSGGLFISIFVGAFSIPSINDYIGYGNLAEQGMSLAGDKIHDYKTWKLSRPENMDVYLHYPIEMIDEDEMPQQSLKPYILFTKIQEKPNFVGLKNVEVGPYLVVLVPPRKPDYIK